MTNDQQHNNQPRIPWQPPTITTLSISRDTEQGPLDPPGSGAQS